MSNKSILKGFHSDGKNGFMIKGKGRFHSDR